MGLQACVITLGSPVIFNLAVHQNHHQNLLKGHVTQPTSEIVIPKYSVEASNFFV
jgi:hypothetical protein